MYSFHSWEIFIDCIKVYTNRKYLIMKMNVCTYKRHYLIEREKTPFSEFNQCQIMCSIFRITHNMIIDIFFNLDRRLKLRNGLKNSAETKIIRTFQYLCQVSFYLMIINWSLPWLALVSMILYEFIFIHIGDTEHFLLALKCCLTENWPPNL